MSTSSLDLRGTRSALRPRCLLFIGWLGLSGGLGLLGCLAGGTHASGDHAGQISGLYQITPPVAVVSVGQTFQFSASSPWGGNPTWSVVPATGCTLDAGGSFTASMATGQYLIVAFWTEDVRYTATATVTVVPAPPPALLNEGLVQAFGQLQASADGHSRNDNVAGEPVPAQTAEGMNGNIQIRHGFHLPPAS